MPSTSSMLSTMMQFACAASDEGATPFSFCNLADGSGELQLRPVRVEIEDIRPALEAGQGPKLDVQGFEVIKNVYEGLDEGDEMTWTEQYERKMEQLLQEHLKARRVVSFAGAAIRRRDPKLDGAPIDTANLQPSASAHVDGNAETGREKCIEVFGLSEEEIEKERCAIINLWRPLKGPLVDAPLAVCDTRTTTLQDVVATVDFYGPGSYIKHSDRQKWFYLRDMMPDEALIFRCQDSTRHPNEGGMTPHTGVMDEERKHLSHRQSVEIRCAVLY